MKRVTLFTLHISLPIQVEQAVVMSRIVVSMTIDCRPIRRYTVQTVQELFDGSRINEYMRVRRKLRVDIAQT